MEENTHATGGVETGAQGATDNGNGQGQEENKTYSEKDFQSEVDRRVTEALKTAHTKWQTEYETKLKAEKDEAARLAKMSADERAQAEFDKRVKDFEDREAKHMPHGRKTRTHGRKCVPHTAIGTSTVTAKKTSTNVK